MAVVHAPAGSADQVAGASGDQIPGAEQAGVSGKKRRPRGPMPLPMIALGVLVIFAVGFGAGEVRQFDKDWRTGTPHLVVQTHGQLTAGSDLGETVSQLLAGDNLDVHAVTCGDSDPGVAGVLGGAAAQLPGEVAAPDLMVCRASSALGMVTIVATPHGDDVDVAVFAAP